MKRVTSSLVVGLVGSASIVAWSTFALLQFLDARFKCFDLRFQIFDLVPLPEQTSEPAVAPGKGGEHNPTDADGYRPNHELKRVVHAGDGIAAPLPSGKPNLKAHGLHRGL